MSLTDNLSESELASIMEARRGRKNKYTVAFLVLIRPAGTLHCKIIDGQTNQARVVDFGPAVTLVPEGLLQLVRTTIGSYPSSDPDQTDTVYL